MQNNPVNRHMADQQHDQLSVVVLYGDFCARRRRGVFLALSQLLSLCY